MKKSLDDFLDYEISEMHKNIDRITHGLEGHSSDETNLAGQFELLMIQQQHLAFIERIQQDAKNYDDAIRLCRQIILQNEEAHREIAQHETPTEFRHSPQWWQTLHDIQFGCDFLNRIISWQRTYNIGKQHGA